MNTGHGQYTRTSHALTIDLSTSSNIVYQRTYIQLCIMLGAMIMLIYLPCALTCMLCWKTPPVCSLAFSV